MELFFRRWGQTAPRLVLLHGMGGTGALWRPIAAALEDRFELLSPDQRGHGQSQIPATPGARETPKYTPLDYGRDVIETMEAQDFHPAWLLGHSMGVRTACAAAHLRPDWVEGLILVDLGFYGPAGGGLGEGLASFLKILPMQFASRQTAREFMNENCPDPSIGQYLMAVSVQTPEGLRFPFDKSALIQTIQAAKDVSVRAWVSELLEKGKRILVLRGAESLVWSAEEFREEKERFARYPTIEFREMPGAGHGLPFEKRIEFVATVEEWISGGARK